MKGFDNTPFSLGKLWVNLFHGGGGGWRPPLGKFLKNHPSLASMFKLLSAFVILMPNDKQDKVFNTKVRNSNT